jgi:hypothetical protein
MPTPSALLMSSRGLALGGGELRRSRPGSDLETNVVQATVSFAMFNAATSSFLKFKIATLISVAEVVT